MQNPTSIAVQALLAVADILPTAFAQAKKANIRRYDCIIGLIFEPVWFWYGHATGQWAFSFLGAVFFVICAYGFYHKWIKGNINFGEEKPVSANQPEVSIMHQSDVALDVTCKPEEILPEVTISATIPQTKKRRRRRKSPKK